MATVEQHEASKRFVLEGISWETYEMLLRDRGDRPSPRLAFDRGRLEFMSPSQEHEHEKQLIGTLIVLWTIEKRIPQCGLGSLTIRKKHLLRGVEPDQCYYLRNEPLVRGKRELDFSIDPPPDLAIEIDVSRSSAEKLQVYAALGVSEVWLFDGECVNAHELTESGNYAPCEISPNLPGFPVASVGEWIERAFESDETTWAIRFQEWVRDHT